MPVVANDNPQWLLETPTPAEVEEMRQLGLQPGAVGYDEHGNLVRRLSDGSVEVIPG